MLTKIKIMLGEEKHKPLQGYDSFVKDVMTSQNKTIPRIEDHDALAQFMKKLRGDAECKNLGASEWDDYNCKQCQCPRCSEPKGVMAKIKKKIYG